VVALLVERLDREAHAGHAVQGALGEADRARAARGGGGDAGEDLVEAGVERGRVRHLGERDLHPRGVARLDKIRGHIIRALMTTTWKPEHAIEPSAAPEIVWRLFRDVAGWRRWNAGVERIELDGPFAAGTWFTMVPPGQEPLRSRLIEVREDQGFVDETRLDDPGVPLAPPHQPRGPGGRAASPPGAAGPGA